MSQAFTNSQYHVVHLPDTEGSVTHQAGLRFTQHRMQTAHMCTEPLLSLNSILTLAFGDCDANGSHLLNTPKASVTRTSRYGSQFAQCSPTFHPTRSPSQPGRSGGAHTTDQLLKILLVGGEEGLEFCRQTWVLSENHPRGLWEVMCSQPWMQPARGTARLGEGGIGTQWYGLQETLMLASLVSAFGSPLTPPLSHCPLPVLAA